MIKCLFLLIFFTSCGTNLKSREDIIKFSEINAKKISKGNKLLIPNLIKDLPEIKKDSEN